MADDELMVNGAVPRVPRATGSVRKHRGRWTARVTFTIDGRRHETRIRAENKAAAGDLVRELLSELRSVGPEKYIETMSARRSPFAGPRHAVNDPKVRTFGQLAEHYKEEYACEPKERSGHRYAGIATWKYVRQHVDTLRTELGDNLSLSALTFERIRALKLKRLNTPIRLKFWKKQKPRSFANVNRMLAVLRRMIIIAVRLKWMTENPFTSAQSSRDKLISLDQENERERILSVAEEKALLAKLENRSLAAILALLDTGARAGEFVRGSKDDRRHRVRWSDIDFTDNVITVYGSKTEKERQVGLTPRLKTALREVQKWGSAPDAEVFGFLSYTVLRNDFCAAMTGAGINGVRLHDLRHTRATRWIQGGLNESEVAYLLGHSKKSHVTRRYINPDERTIARSLAADVQFTKGQAKRRSREAVN